MSNLSSQIFAVDDIETELVEVKVWGVTVLVKSMTARDRAKMVASAANASGAFNLEEVLPDLVIHCTFDPETNEQVFRPTDRDALLAKSAAAIEQIATVAMRLSGMDEDAVDEAGKDSSPTPTEDSSSN
jgi:hypothetical protein